MYKRQVNHLTTAIPVWNRSSQERVLTKGARIGTITSSEVDEAEALEPEMAYLAIQPHKRYENNASECESGEETATPEAQQESENQAPMIEDATGSGKQEEKYANSIRSYGDELTRAALRAVAIKYPRL